MATISDVSNRLSAYRKGKIEIIVFFFRRIRNRKWFTFFRNCWFFTSVNDRSKTFMRELICWTSVRIVSTVLSNWLIAALKSIPFAPIADNSVDVTPFDKSCREEKCKTVKFDGMIWCWKFTIKFDCSFTETYVSIGCRVIMTARPSRHGTRVTNCWLFNQIGIVLEKWNYHISLDYFVISNRILPQLYRCTHRRNVLRCSSVHWSNECRCRFRRHFHSCLRNRFGKPSFCQKPELDSLLSKLKCINRKDVR